MVKLCTSLSRHSLPSEVVFSPPQISQKFPSSLHDFIAALCTWRKQTHKDKVYAICLYTSICDAGLQAHPLIGNDLVSMLVDIGKMNQALHVFEMLEHQDGHLCNLMIMGYASCGESQALIDFYHKMGEHELPCLTGHSYVILVKACIKLEDVDSGSRLHIDVVRMGLLERNVFVGSALVDMYAKCGLLMKAQETFEMISIRNVVSWNTLITGYADHGHFEEVLKCSKQMQYDGIVPDAITYMCCLRACSGTGATLDGKEIHDEITRKGLLEGDVFLGTTLIDMYAKCDMLVEAKQVLVNLPVRNVVSWNALISGYVDNGRGNEALVCFENMEAEGVSPSPVTFIHSLKACDNVETIDKIHAEIAKKGLLEKDVMLSSTLVYIYAKIGMIIKAQDVFDKVLIRNVVSWNALIAGYVEHGYGEEALTCFERMQQVGLSPDVITLIFSLKACIITATIALGEDIHLEIAKKGLEGDQLLSSTVIHMYAKCGSPNKAQEVFDKLSHRNVVSWTALITGYAELGHTQQALLCYEQMCFNDVLPSTITYICSLKACASIGAVAKGQEMHVKIVKRGIEIDSALGSVLIDMYTDSGMLMDALASFDSILVHEVFSWTSIMRANVECHSSEEAINCFEQMQLEGVSPDVITYVFVIKACVNVGDIRKATKIHAEIMKKGLEKELLIGNALIDMYAKHGLLEAAQEVFEKLPNRDIISWNVIITAFADFGHNDHVLKCLEQIYYAGISPDPVALICSLVSCANVGAIVKGQEIHAQITKRGLEREILIGNALIDLYVKCGSCTVAKFIFDSLQLWTTVSWNALIIGYTQVAANNNVLELFNMMLRGGTMPDLVTFLNVLNACSHAGLVDKGEMYFEAMINDFDLIPAVEHYNCMVDLFGRAGNIDKAVAMIKKMPLHPGTVLLQTLLASCRRCGNVQIARLAFGNVVGLDETEDAVYICMYNIHIEAAMQEDANKVELMRAQR